MLKHTFSFHLLLDFGDVHISISFWYNREIHLVTAYGMQVLAGIKG